MITKIVTARDTDFVVRGYITGRGLDVTVTNIEPVFWDDTYLVNYVVSLSNDSHIEVKDVVEIWRENDS